MAAYNKFNFFTQDVCRAVYNFNSADVFKVLLTNTVPLATNHVYADVSAGELTTTGGYTVGGISSATTDSSTSGTEKVVATNVTWTGSGAGMGPFRYVVFYDNTPTSPAKPLVCWFDFGSSISLASGDTFTVAFDGTNGLFQMT